MWRNIDRHCICSGAPVLERCKLSQASTCHPRWWPHSPGLVPRLRHPAASGRVCACFDGLPWPDRCACPLCEHFPVAHPFLAILSILFISQAVHLCGLNSSSTRALMSSQADLACINCQSLAAGGSREGYCKAICAAALQKGWRAAVLNYRGCAGKMPSGVFIASGKILGNSLTLGTRIIETRKGHAPSHAFPWCNETDTYTIPSLIHSRTFTRVALPAQIFIYAAILTEPTCRAAAHKFQDVFRSLHR